LIIFLSLILYPKYFMPERSIPAVIIAAIINFSPWLLLYDTKSRIRFNISTNIIFIQTEYRFIEILLEHILKETCRLRLTNLQPIYLFFPIIIRVFFLFRLQYIIFFPSSLLIILATEQSIENTKEYQLMN
jgi:hypothetical protein